MNSRVARVGRVVVGGKSRRGRLAAGAAVAAGCAAGALLAGCGEVLAPAAPVPFQDLAVGAYHACALDIDGGAWCWGRGDQGALGTGGLGDERRATRVFTTDGTPAFTAVVAAGGQTCALDEAGGAWCWGTALSVPAGRALVPTRVEGASPFVAIAAGEEHACGVTGAGVIQCWGGGERGQLGRGDAATGLEPAPVAGGVTFTTVTAAGRHTCGLASDGRPYCWGANDQGQLGDGTLVDRATPTPIPDHAFTQIDAGFANTCAIGADVWCWGAAADGQPGDYNYFPTRGPEPMPVRLGGSLATYPLRTVDAGHLVICGVYGQGRNQGMCWGNGEFGQIGNGKTGDQAGAQFVTLHPARQHNGDALRFRFVDPSGVRHTCGLSSEGAAFCWGTGDRGELGSPGTLAVIPQRVLQAD